MMSDHAKTYTRYNLMLVSASAHKHQNSTSLSGSIVFVSQSAIEDDTSGDALNEITNALRRAMLLGELPKIGMSSAVSGISIKRALTDAERAEYGDGAQWIVTLEYLSAFEALNLD